MMRLMFIALSTLFILLFLLFYSFEDVLSQLRMSLRVSKVKGSLSLVGMLYLGIGVLFVVMVRVVPFLLFIPGKIGFLLICMVFIGGFLIPLRCEMVLFDRLLSLVEMKVSDGGIDGSGRI